MNVIASQGVSWAQLDFLNKALDVLCQSRRTLMFTYILAYFLETSNQVILD
jgi:hypothetical protein